MSLWKAWSYLVACTLDRREYSSVCNPNFELDTCWSWIRWHKQYWRFGHRAAIIWLGSYCKDAIYFYFPSPRLHSRRNWHYNYIREFEVHVKTDFLEPKPFLHLSFLWIRSSDPFGDVTLKLMSGEMMLATSTFEYTSIHLLLNCSSPLWVHYRVVHLCGCMEQGSLEWIIATLSLTTTQNGPCQGWKWL